MDELVDAVAALEPKPRGRRWASLSSCVVDAVWSIGVRYNAVTVKVTRDVFAACVGDTADPLVAPDDLTTPDPVPLDTFLEHFPTVDTLLAVSNGNLTSPRGGIPKADAARRHATVLLDAGVRTRLDALEVLHDDTRFATVTEQLRRIPGEGAYGVRRGYLWMLAGDDDGIKPDRMVLRWLDAHGTHVTPAEAAPVLRDVAAELSTRSPTPVTPWMVDHAIWNAARALPRRSRRPRKT